MSGPEFDAHLSAIAKVRDTSPSTAQELAMHVTRRSLFLLTFDDGGESAATCIADLLEKHGWRGHFFVTTAGPNRQEGLFGWRADSRLEK